MVSTKHNDVLYNAAIAGISAGCLNGKDFDQITSATIASVPGAAQQAAIAAAALAVDAAVPFDAELSVSSSDGTMLVTPFAGSGTAAQIAPFFSKPNLLSELCQAAFAGATLNSPLEATYATIAAAIAAQYAAGVTQLLDG